MKQPDISVKTKVKNIWQCLQATLQFRESKNKFKY